MWQGSPKVCKTFYGSQQSVDHDRTTLRSRVIKEFGKLRRLFVMLLAGLAISFVAFNPKLTVLFPLRDCFQAVTGQN